MGQQQRMLGLLVQGQLTTWLIPERTHKLGHAF